jgi:mRNA-degrading endonuclease toxin of MazEF toxin-antitoxin module
MALLRSTVRTTAVAPITGASRGLSSRARKKVQRLATAKETDASASKEGEMEAVRALARARGALAREKGPNDDPIALQLHITNH